MILADFRVVQDEIHPDVQWPADCQSKYLDEYHALAAAMKQRVLKSQKCYREKHY